MYIMWYHVALILVKEYGMRSSIILTWLLEFIFMNIVDIQSYTFKYQIFSF
jgi:hypothetical protein